MVYYYLNMWRAYAQYEHSESTSDTRPIALSVSPGGAASGDVAAALKNGYVPAILRPMPQGGLRWGYKPAGAKGVWTKVEKVGANKVAVVYIEVGEGESFKQKAAEYISSLNGYGKVEGSERLFKALEKRTGVKINRHELLVIDTLGLTYPSGQDFLVKTDIKNFAEYPIEKKVHDAQRYAATPEIGFVTRWSNALKRIPHFNRSLVFTVNALQEAYADNRDNIKIFQSKGAKIYVMYDGKDKEEAQRIIALYGLNGIIYTDPDVEVSEMVQGNENLFVAGAKVLDTTGHRKKYVTIHLDQPELEEGLEQKIRDIPEGSVVRIVLGTSELDNERLLLLNNLSPSDIVILDSKELKEDSMTRDITQIIYSGENLLKQLQWTPKPEEKAQVRKEAYALEIGTFEKYDNIDQLKEDTARVLSGIADAKNLEGFAGNENLFKAVRHRALSLGDAERQEYLNAVVERLQERTERAEAGKLGDLADINIEMQLGALITRNNEIELSQRKPAFSEVMERFKQRAVNLSSEQFQLELYRELKAQEAIAQGTDTQAQPQAVSTMIELIILYAGEPMHVLYNGKPAAPMSVDATSAILEAA
jgi:hypothetical protein